MLDFVGFSTEACPHKFSFSCVSPVLRSEIATEGEFISWLNPALCSLCSLVVNIRVFRRCVQSSLLKQRIRQDVCIYLLAIPDLVAAATAAAVHRRGVVEAVG